MASKYIKVEGEFHWAKVYEPDTFGNATRYCVDFIPRDEANEKLITDSGIRLKRRFNEEGRPVYRFRRDIEKVFSGDRVVFMPPEITGLIEVKYVNEEGEQVRSYTKGVEEEPKRVGTPIIIGNGTRGKLTFVAYDSSMGKGSRLEALEITDLVEYKKPDKPQKNDEQIKDTETSNDGLPW